MDLAEYLDPDRFDVEMVSLSPYSGEIFEDYLRDAGVNVHYLSKKLGFDPHIFFEVHRVICGFKPQVVHNHLHALYTLLPSSLVNKIPVRIHTIHNLAVNESHGIHRIVNHMAFHIMGVLPVSISQTIQRSVHDIYGEIDSPVIYNGVDLEKYSPLNFQPSKLREQFGIPSDAFVFLNVASFSPQKNQRLLIFAFKDVLLHFQSVFLLLVGDGELKQEMENLVTELGISNKVLFTGKRSDVAQILSACDCFVLSSDWEGLPICILEAMAARKPIIATDAGGVPELISDSENGLLVPAGNRRLFGSAMIRLYQDPFMAMRMGGRSRQIVEERFNVREMAQQYGDLYLKLLREYNSNKH
jgi:glycosyltransferase involved in cell wall biosynthesis